MRRIESQQLLGFLFASATIFSGIYLPYFVQSPKEEPAINVIWNTLYGLGYEITASVWGELVLSRSVGLTGGIIWPALLFVFVYSVWWKCAKSSLPKHSKILFSFLACVSLFANIRINQAIELSLPCYTFQSWVNF